MKIKFLISMLLVAMIFTLNLKATTNCDGKCDAPWINPYSASPPEIQYIVDVNQTWQINYIYRECIDAAGIVHREIKITGLVLKSGTATGTTSELLQKALKTLLWNSSSIFSNCSGFEGWDVTVITECCWRTFDYGAQIPGYLFKMPCNINSCCKYKYNIRPVSDGFGGTKFEVDHTVNFSTDCNIPNSCTMEDQTCFNICDYGQLENHTDLTPETGFCNPCVKKFNPNPLNKVHYFLGGSNTNNYWDLYYASLECNNTIYISCWQISYGITFSGFPGIAVAKIIRQVLSTYPTPLSYPLNIKFVVPSCWTYYRDMQLDGGTTRPCSWDNCCEIDYTIDFDGTNYTATSRNITPNSITCLTPNCVNICNNSNFLFPINTPFPKLSLDLDKERIENQKESLKVRPNPTSGESTIELESEINGKLTFILTDMSGKIIQKYEKFKSTKSFSFNFDGTDLTQGTYQVQLLMNNQVIANGSVLIQK